MPETSVLVVDDEESVATTIQAILQLDGHEVVAVTTGAEAIRILGERQFDVVLTDLRLADVDGVEVLKEVQRTAPETAAIMLTGYASLESAIAALRSGAYDYLMKPSDVEELRATVNRAIERRLLRRRLVELEEVDRLKTQFLSMASHELRTPLTAVMGFIQVARRRLVRASDKQGATDWKEEATRAAETLELAQRQSRRLARLVDELLDVSRLQLGRVQMTRSEIDLVTSLREVVERLRLLNTTHAFEFSDHAKTAPVLADRDRIDQVFNLFYRSPDPRAGHVGGLGLGLYISREIVTRHGGKLWAESAGEGSTFHVTLPLAAPAAKAGAVKDPAGARRA